MTRLGVWVLRFRDWALWVLPILGFAVGMALLLTLAIVSVTVAGERDDQAETLRQVREAAEVNRRLIERGNPCIAGDDPNSEACIAQRLADTRLADALAAVQAQHDEQARQVADAVDRLIELQLRNHGSTANAGASPRPPTRPAPRITASGPTSATTTATTAPAAPTTVCPERGKRPKECR